jgi:hypothetical protein
VTVIVGRIIILILEKRLLFRYMTLPVNVVPYTPDWTDPTKYPSSTTKRYLDYSKLAWEFLRRNKNYAADVQQLLRLPKLALEKGSVGKGTWCLDCTECFPSAQLGETAGEYKKRMKGQKYHISAPLNVFIRRWCLMTPIDPKESYSIQKMKFQVPIGYSRDKSAKLRRLHDYLLPHEVAVRFTLNLPLKAQWKLAEDRLIEFKKKLDQRVPDKTAKNTRLKDVFEQAHYLLRCYDAFQNVRQKVTAKDIELFLIQENPKAIKKAFKSKKQERKKPIGAEACFEAADRFINKLKYLKLVIDAPAPTPQELLYRGSDKDEGFSL